MRAGFGPRGFITPRPIGMPTSFLGRSNGPQLGNTASQPNRNSHPGICNAAEVGGSGTGHGNDTRGGARSKRFSKIDLNPNPPVPSKPPEARRIARFERIGRSLAADGNGEAPAKRTAVPPLAHLPPASRATLQTPEALDELAAALTNLGRELATGDETGTARPPEPTVSRNGRTPIPRSNLLVAAFTLLAGSIICIVGAISNLDSEPTELSPATTHVPDTTIYSGRILTEGMSEAIIIGKNGRQR